MFYIIKIMDEVIFQGKQIKKQKILVLNSLIYPMNVHKLEKLSYN
ncbi:hypothetical protein Ga0061079_10565 [Apibacter mensalis]|uniref:Uncharacterized protein n=1 Tax=Apibacter mensalis TaxID=1586267 RepID=A0A0X3AP30_9FLAO|nr:hypothetical protein Ga0061079_10565 [Apibacter mensalis]